MQSIVIDNYTGSDIYLTDHPVMQCNVFVCVREFMNILARTISNNKFQLTNNKSRKAGNYKRAVFYAFSWLIYRDSKERQKRQTVRAIW